MSTSIKIPESLQFYFASEKNASAIEQVIDSDSIPPGLTWHEADQYNNAKTSTHTLQLDHWRFLKEVWERTWGVSIINNSFKEVPSDFYEDAFSLENVWEDGELYRAFILNSNIAYFYCSLNQEGEIRLYFYVESDGGKYEISNNLSLSPENWQPSDEDENRYTEKAIILSEQTNIDIEPLTISADEAILSLKSF